MSAPTLAREAARGARRRPERPDRAGAVRQGLARSRWRVGLAGALAVLLASLALQPLLDGAWWLSRSIVVVAAVTLTGVLVRAVRAPAPLQPVAQAVALLVTLVALFVGESARWGFLPGPAAITALRELAASGRAFAEQTVAPAGFDPGLQLLVVAGVGLVALVVDTLAVGLDLPGLTLAPLGALFVVAWAIGRGQAPPLAFVLVAVAWLLVLASTQRDRVAGWGPGARPGSALATFGIGAVAVVLALVAGGLTALRGPAGSIGDFGVGTGGGTVTLDAMVSLRRSLVQNDDRVVLSFATTAQSPDYLRLAVLEAFDGEQWRSAGPAELGARPPLAPSGVGAGTGPLTEYRLDVGPLTGTTLPSPSGTIASLNDWPVAFDQRTSLPVRTDGATIQGERVGLVAAVPALDAQVLRAASTAGTAGAALDPANLADPSPVVTEELGELAREVTAGAETPYDAAVALQRWFTTDGGFTYSTAIEGGSDDDALATFLDERVGYCEQFAATMALMARSIGVPARVVVGFTQGRPEGPQWVVRGTDAHAWPELWMGSAGWVRFEPTPGAPTATVPSYSRPLAEAAEPTAAPTQEGSQTGPTDEALPGGIPEDEGIAAAGGGAASGGARWWPLGLALGLLVLALPLAWRTARRRRRLARGDGEAAYAEVVDTAADLGLPLLGSTPRSALAEVRRLVGAAPTAGPEVGSALDRIQRAVEWQRYGPAGAATPRRGALSADVALVRRALAGRCGPGRRLGALVVPRSLLPGTLVGPAPQAPDRSGDGGSSLADAGTRHA